MLGLGRAGVLLEPFGLEGELFEEMVPVVNENFDHPPLDHSLFVHICSDTSDRCSTNGQITEREGGRMRLSLSCTALESNQGLSHFLDN